MTRKTEMPTAAELLPGRTERMSVPQFHFVNQQALSPPFPETFEIVYFGMGCFWGAERKFWSLPGVHVTAVGYMAGTTPNPTYQEVCSGLTGHNEAVMVVFDASILSFEQLLKVFWESHDPTQGMRQGNDVGTQYRSGIYVSCDAQQEFAQQSLVRYQAGLTQAGRGRISTEIIPATEFYFAEAYHQQYLAKNPMGYCGIGGLGVAYPD